MGCGASSGSYKEPRKIETKWYNEFAAKLPSMEGKVVLITGCTSGTGLVAAKTLARKGAHVVMLNRKSSRAEEAEKKVLEEAPGSKAPLNGPRAGTGYQLRTAGMTILEMEGFTGVAPVPRAVPVPRFAMDHMHKLGRCTPCRFFAFKDDGCHKGDLCEVGFEYCCKKHLQVNSAIFALGKMH